MATDKTDPFFCNLENTASVSCGEWKQSLSTSNKTKNKKPKKIRGFHFMYLASQVWEMPCLQSRPSRETPDYLTCTSMDARQGHEQVKKIYDLFKGTVQQARA